MTALHLRGTMLPHGEQRDVYIVDGTITFEPVRAAETVSERGWMLPGLVDAHAHLAIAQAQPAADPRVQREHAIIYRNAGALLLRDAGAPVPLDPSLLADETLPRLQTAGRFISPPRRYLPGFAREVTTTEELVAAATEEAAASRGWVKLIADWRDTETKTYEPNFSAEQFGAAIEAAHRSGARVAAHSMHPEASANAVAAGVDTLEHGPGIGADTVAAMVERGTGYVPTLHAVKHTLAAVSQARSSPARDLLVEVMSRHSAAVRAAYEAGVRILVGTDGGGVIEHGEVVTEILELVDAGLSPEAAVSAGSWDARSFFGLPGIDEGAPADLGVYPSDPRTDPRVLRSPDLLILAGKALAVPSH